MLSLLLIHRGVVVPLDEIIDALWEESPPANGRNAVQVVASRLRSVVGAETVFSAGGGYGMRVAPGSSTLPSSRRCSRAAAAS